MTGAPGRDRLIVIVERAIERHLPGGTLGVDVPSMAREVVRQVRRQVAVERLEETTAKFAESLESIAPARRGEVPRYGG
ncbi:hypothetical protein AB0D98_19635 [Streptomyces sp. NPDC047987]|uniref:hypothetical protein n=1 Tax=unclassified Streptomyces TaxID=2593676 RepID=UPI003443AD6B